MKKIGAMHEINLMIVLDIRIKPCDVGIFHKKCPLWAGKNIKNKVWILVITRIGTNCS